MSGDEIEIEEDEIRDGWALAPVEACSFVVLAVFAHKRHARSFLAVLRKAHPRKFDDIVIIPASALVRGANTFDDAAGHLALDAKRGTA